MGALLIWSMYTTAGMLRIPFLPLVGGPVPTIIDLWLCAMACPPPVLDCFRPDRIPDNAISAQHSGAVADWDEFVRGLWTLQMFPDAYFPGDLLQFKILVRDYTNRGALPRALFTAFNNLYRGLIKRSLPRAAVSIDSLLANPRSVLQNFRFSQAAMTEVLFYLALPEFIVYVARRRTVRHYLFIAYRVQLCAQWRSFSLPRACDARPHGRAEAAQLPMHVRRDGRLLRSR